MLKKYEQTVIFDGNLENDQVTAEQKKIEDIITSHGGTILDVNKWGRRKLAYPIRKKDQGFYIVMQLEMEGSAIVEMEREFELNEALLRYLTIAVEKDMEEGEGKEAEAEVKADDETPKSKEVSAEQETKDEPVKETTEDAPAETSDAESDKKEDK